MHAMIEWLFRGMINMFEYPLTFYYGHHGLDIFISVLIAIGSLASLALILFDSSKTREQMIKRWTKRFLWVFLVCSLIPVVLNYFCPEFNYRNGIIFWKGENNYAISTEIAINAFRKAAEREHPLGCRYLGYILLFKQNNPEGLKMLDKAIKLGDAEAAGMLGRYYEYHCKDLEEDTRKKMAYIAYYEAVYLGAKHLQKKVAEFKPYVSLAVQDMAIDECKKISTMRKP